MFWAHSDPAGLALDAEGSRAQRLAKHLANVSEIAAEMARNSAPGDDAFESMARSAGMLHDLGKYSACFQRMLSGGPRGCPHSIYGALAVVDDATRDKQAYPVAAAIAAHHAGLRDRADLVSHLLSKSERAVQRDELRHFLTAAIEDQPRILDALKKIPVGRRGGSLDLQMRMLLSCLVDADRLDTAARPNRQEPLRAAERLKQLRSYLAEVAAQSGESAVKLLLARASVQDACRDAALGTGKRFSLSVPTGGGKTLAAMRFALERAAARPEVYRRIIVVIPFLSIIEQNAAVYRSVFGDDAIFEHHSGAVYNLPIMKHGDTDYFSPQDEEQREATEPALSAQRAETENWDAPVIVTTSVRFFESLFSHHPSDLRRAHNLARSIIIFDEVQTLPRRLLAPLLGMLRDLTEEWGCTLLMATATLPAFEKRGTHAPACLWDEGDIFEIIADPESLHTTLQRVRIEWRLDQPTAWTDLVEELLQEQQVLCVVNIREHAAKVFDLMRTGSVSEEDRSSCFHLSTRMCAEHRLAVLAVIRERLRQGLPCRVVSTQLIEAGVDVDFPVAYRALGPLDAVVQVAGRVDREGKRTAAQGAPAGRLIVFQTVDGRTPPHEYAEATAITESLARSKAPQPSDLQSVKRYFERYYGETDDRARGEDLAAMRSNRDLKFRTLSDQFEMINSRTRDVFVPYGAGAGYLHELMQVHHIDYALLRKLQRYSVGLQPWEFQAARDGGSIFEAWAGSDVWVASTAAYDEQSGLLTKQDEAKLII